MNPIIITRKEWGAKEARHITSMSLPVPYVIVHHSYKPETCHTFMECVTAMQSMQHYHQDVRLWDDIGYK